MGKEVFFFLASNFRQINNSAYSLFVKAGNLELYLLIYLFLVHLFLVYFMFLLYT